MKDDGGNSGRVKKLEQILSDAKPAKVPRKRALNSQKSNVVSIFGTGNVVGNGNSIVNNIIHNPPPVVTKVFVTAGDGVITEQQKVILKTMVDDIVALERELKRAPKGHGAVWGALNKKMDVSSYHLIPIEKFPAAQKTLGQWRGRLLSAKSAPKALGEDLRNRRIAAIQTRSRQIPNGTARRLAYLQEQFGASSLTELDDAQVERVYRHIINWKP